MRDAMGGAEFVCEIIAANTQRGLERAGCVIQSGMNYAAVSGTCAHAQLRHLLEKKDVCPLCGSGARDRASHHAASDDYDVGPVHVNEPPNSKFRASTRSVSP